MSLVTVTGELAKPVRKRNLMLDSQLARKARLDPYRHDVKFKPSDEVTSSVGYHTHTPLPSGDKLLPRCHGWATSACSPRQLRTHWHRLDVPLNLRALSEFNVELLSLPPRPPGAGWRCRGARQAPVQGLDGQLEYEVEAILMFCMRTGRPHVLVRWTGLDASGDSWEPLDSN